MIQETLSGIGALNNPSLPFYFSAEGNDIVGRWKWMDATFFTANGVTSEVKEYEFRVTLFDNGTYCEHDKMSNKWSSADVRNGKVEFGKSGFSGHANSKQMVMGFGKNNDTEKSGVIGFKLDTSMIKSPLRQYLNACGYINVNFRQPTNVNTTWNYNNPQVPFSGSISSSEGYPQMNESTNNGMSRSRKEKKHKTKKILLISLGVLAALILLFIVLTSVKITVKKEGGCKSPEDAIKMFWSAYREADKEKFSMCLYNSEDVESNLTNAEKLKANTEIYDSEIIIEDTDFGDEISGADETKWYIVTVPMDQVIEGYTYRVDDVYDMTIISQSDSWYVAVVNEKSAQIVSSETTSDYDSSDSGLGDSSDTETQEDDEEFKQDENTQQDMRVGDSFNGYVSIPGSCVPYSGSSITGSVSTVQYASPDGLSVITLCALDTDSSISSAAESIKNAEGDSGRSLSSITIEDTYIGGYEAKLVSYYDGGSNLFTYSWLFRCDESDCNYLHYITCNFTAEDITSLEWVSTYSRK